MQKNKISILILSIALIITMAGCTSTNRNMRNLSTQTRLRDNNPNDRFLNDDNSLKERDRTNNLNNTRDPNHNLDGDPLDNNTNLNNGMTRPDTINRTAPDNDSSNNMSNMRNRATTIAKRVSDLPEINNASVLINGNTAIVGCDVKDNDNNQISAALKQKVEAAVKTADRNIRNVSVTSDPNLYTRIKDLTTDINNNVDGMTDNMQNNPITDFTREIEDIMKQITNIR